MIEEGTAIIGLLKDILEKQHWENDVYCFPNGDIWTKNEIIEFLSEAIRRAY